MYQSQYSRSQGTRSAGFFAIHQGCWGTQKQKTEVLVLPFPICSNRAAHTCVHFAGHFLRVLISVASMLEQSGREGDQMSDANPARPSTGSSRNIACRPSRHRMFLRLAEHPFQVSEYLTLSQERCSAWSPSIFLSDHLGMYSPARARCDFLILLRSFRIE